MTVCRWLFIELVFIYTSISQTPLNPSLQKRDTKAIGEKSEEEGEVKEED